MNFFDRLIKDKKYRNHIMTYFIFGVITTMVSWGSFYLIRKLVPTIEENVANVISIVLAVIVAYIVNRKYVFHSTESDIIGEFIKFCSGRVLTMLVEVILFFVLATLIGIDEMMVKVLVSIIVMILNYVFSKKIVFKKSDCNSQSLNKNL